MGTVKTVNGQRTLNLPDEENESEYVRNVPQESAKYLLRRAKYLQKKMHPFRKQSKKEHLTSVRQRHSSQRNQHFSEETVAVAEIALIHDETPRNKWKLGIIAQLHQGKDGFAGSTANGKHISSPTLLSRLYYHLGSCFHFIL